MQAKMLCAKQAVRSTETPLAHVFHGRRSTFGLIAMSQMISSIPWQTIESDFRLFCAVQRNLYRSVRLNMHQINVRLRKLAAMGRHLSRNRQRQMTRLNRLREDWLTAWKDLDNV